MVFMVAGYDTTATTLCWLAYDLATHPDIQETLIEEIDSEIGQVIHITLIILLEKAEQSGILEKRLRCPVWTSAQTDQSLRCPHEESSGP